MKKRIYRIARKMAKKEGLINITREKLCAAAGISPGSFSHHMKKSFSEFINELKPEFDEVSNVQRYRVDPAYRKKQILISAVDVADRDGFDKLERLTVAKEAGVSVGLVSNYFGTLTQLKRAVMRYAVQNEMLSIIACGLAIKDPQAMKLSDEIKQKAVKELTK